MGIVQDRRPRDWAYAATFDKKDLPSLQDMARYIRETHDTDMIEVFNTRCEQKLNFSTESTELDNGIEIQSVIKTEDIVVNVGLQQCINLIIGTSSIRWGYMVSGSGPAATPSISDTALAAEHSPRTNMNTNGWTEPKGMKLFFGAIVGGLSPLTITELGVNTASSGGILLNHENFGNNTLGRSSTDSIVANQIFILSIVVEFCPVA